MHMHSPKQDPQRWVQDHPEPGGAFDREVGLRVSVGFGIGIVVTSVLTFIGMWYLMVAMLGPQDRTAEAPRVQQMPPPEPRLQVHPERDLQKLLAEQNHRLASWGWVDESQDRGHIAIDAAMQLIADRGLPVRAQPRHWENPLLWRNPSLTPLHAGGHP